MNRVIRQSQNRVFQSVLEVPREFVNVRAKRDGASEEGWSQHHRVGCRPPWAGACHCTHSNGECPQEEEVYLLVEPKGHKMCLGCMGVFSV